MSGDFSSTSASSGVSAEARQDWVEQALCAQTDPALFYPEEGGTPSAVARRVCARCEVRTECLEYALDHDEQYGLWGGLDARQRMRLIAHRGEVA
jgi:WhiB family redox-sensing transcriptional regulator